MWYSEGEDFFAIDGHWWIFDGSWYEWTGDDWLGLKRLAKVILCYDKTKVKIIYPTN